MATTFSQQILKRDLVAMKGAKEQFVIPEHCNWSRHQNRGCGPTLYSSIFNYGRMGYIDY